RSNTYNEDTMLTRNISRTLFKAIVGFTMAVGCAATMAQPADFNVRFSWKLKGEYGGFYAAQEQGYYEKHGLKVHLGEGAGAQAALGALLQGQEDVVVLPGMFALTAIAKGMPIKLAALYAPKASTILLSFPDKPVKE